MNQVPTPYEAVKKLVGKESLVVDFGRLFGSMTRAHSGRSQLCQTGRRGGDRADQQMFSAS